MLTDDVINIVKEGIDWAIRGSPLANSATSPETCRIRNLFMRLPEYFQRYALPTNSSELLVYT